MVITSSNLTRLTSNGKQLSQIGSHGRGAIARMCHDAVVQMMIITNGNWD